MSSFTSHKFSSSFKWSDSLHISYQQCRLHSPWTWEAINTSFIICNTAIAILIPHTTIFMTTQDPRHINGFPEYSLMNVSWTRNRSIQGIHKIRHPKTMTCTSKVHRTKKSFLICTTGPLIRTS